MKNEIIEKFTVLITSAFGLIAALAWNEAIQDIIKKYGFIKYGPLTYAILVTVLAVIITILLGWLSGKAKKLSFSKRRKKSSK